ncbi:MAG TPA: sulfotransferase [Stenomitos sp.]
MKVNNWVYVTGAPRSGTTFVGKILSLPLQVDYIHEPFNPACGIPEINQRYLYVRAAGEKSQTFKRITQKIFDYNFTLRTGYYKNDKPLQAFVKKFIGSRGPFYLRVAKLNPFHETAIIKDPIGCLLTEFITQNFQINPLILVRHPIAFAASAMRLNWDEEVDLSHLLNQPELIEDYFLDDIDFLKQKRNSSVEKAAALWRALNKVLFIQSQRNSNWKVLTHEQLSSAPLETFQELYTSFNLPWTKRVEKIIINSTHSKNSAEASKGTVQQFSRDSSRIFEIRSKMLNLDQRKAVFDITSDVALKFYSPDSFNING